MKFLVTWDFGYDGWGGYNFGKEVFEIQDEAEDFATQLKCSSIDDPYNENKPFNIHVYELKLVL